MNKRDTLINVGFKYLREMMSKASRDGKRSIFLTSKVKSKELKKNFKKMKK